MQIIDEAISRFETKVRCKKGRFNCYSCSLPCVRPQDDEAALAALREIRAQNQARNNSQK